MLDRERRAVDSRVALTRSYFAASGVAQANVKFGWVGAEKWRVTRSSAES